MNYPLMKPRRLTVEEFREMELNAPEEERWELIGGRIIKSMAGGTIRHNRIVLNVATSLRTELRRAGSPCEVFVENVRLEPAASEVSTLPDVIVCCNPPPDETTALTDATVVVEVLSPSTAAFGLNEKLSAYLKLPSLRVCAFVEQASPKVMTYTRSPAGWIRDELVEVAEQVTFEGLDVTLTLEQIYERVSFTRAAG